MNKTSDTEHTETVIIDGCKVLIRYNLNPDLTVMKGIKEALFRQGSMPSQLSKICVNSPNMR